MRSSTRPRHAVSLAAILAAGCLTTTSAFAQSAAAPTAPGDAPVVAADDGSARDQKPPVPPGAPDAPKAPDAPPAPPAPPRGFGGGGFGVGAFGGGGRTGGGGGFIFRTGPDGVRGGGGGFFALAGPDARPEKGAYLGVSTSPAPQSLRQQLQLPKGVGLVVDFVEPKGPAAEAGLRQYDVLHKIDDQILVNEQQLAVLVRSHKPGEEVKITVFRDGKPQTLTAKLAEKELPPLEALRLGELRDLDRIERLLNNPPQPNRPGDGPVGPDGRPTQRGGGGGIGPRPGGFGGGGVGGFGGGAFGRGGFGGGGPLLQDRMMLSWDDGEVSINLTNRDGHQHLSAKDHSGKTLFDGPIDTEEQRKSIPKEVRDRLDKMRNLSAPRPPRAPEPPRPPAPPDAPDAPRGRPTPRDGAPRNDGADQDRGGGDDNAHPPQPPARGAAAAADEADAD
jgi:PDZ domain